MEDAGEKIEIKVNDVTIIHWSNLDSFDIDDGVQDRDFMLDQLEDIMNALIKFYHRVEVPEKKQTCDHFHSFSMDWERVATCNSCGHVWQWDGFPCGNINNGTFKIYGKEQTDPQDAA